MGKYKQDLSKELLTPPVDSLAFIGKAIEDKNQLRRDILKSRLSAKMKQLTGNVPAKSELIFGDDLNKRISQINNTNSAWQNQHLSDQVKMVVTTMSGTLQHHQQ